jgi:hypothetical protein
MMTPQVKKYSGLLLNMRSNPHRHVPFHLSQVSKIKKLIVDKSKLPMAAYEDSIVAAVRMHQAVVIAGDTGESVSGFNHGWEYTCTADRTAVMSFINL